MSKVSFCLLETDNIIVRIKEVAEEYQIPLNSAIKVYFNNVEKEIKSLKEKIDELNTSYSNKQFIQQVVDNKPKAPSVISDPKVQNVSLINTVGIQKSEPAEKIKVDETELLKEGLRKQFGFC